jgi:prepilin-type N-terminal cleavage/methylation domain-containing protein
MTVRSLRLPAHSFLLQDSDMRQRGAFTLIELSIVLVIIALLVGGVLGAKSMFDNAEERTILTEADHYTTAFKEFSDKYQAIPGDMNNATSVWPADDSCPTTTSNTDTKINTCNGDGNGTIGNWLNEVTSVDYELFRAWQQLSNSQIIEGAFTGVSGPNSATQAVAGLNVPLSKTGKAGWTLLHMVSSTDNDYFYAAAPVASHVLIYGGQNTTSYSESTILTPLQARNIDAKTDDGMPFTGKIRAKKSTGSNCSESSAITSDYALTSTLQNCQLMFIMGL